MYNLFFVRVLEFCIYATYSCTSRLIYLFIKMSSWDFWISSVCVCVCSSHLYGWLLLNHRCYWYANFVNVWFLSSACAIRIDSCIGSYFEPRPPPHLHLLHGIQQLITSLAGVVAFCMQKVCAPAKVLLLLLYYTSKDYPWHGLFGCSCGHTYHVYANFVRTSKCCCTFYVRKRNSS